MDWIYIEFNSSPIEKIRKKLINERLKSEGYEMSNKNYAKLIPCFNSTKNIQKPIIRREEKIEASGISFWPDIEKPMIVILDISDDNIIQLWRDELIDQIGEKSIHGNMDIRPHIKLFKSGEIGEERYIDINRKVRDNLIRRSEDIDVPNYITAKNVVREEWD